MIRLIADVHGAADALRRVAPGSTPLFVLGDLINFIDYRDNSGIVSDVAGRDFVERVVALRTQREFGAARELWRAHRKGREEEIRSLYAKAIAAAYEEICAALDGVEAYVTYGNVDSPGTLAATLPATTRFVESDVIEIGGTRIGLVGGGVPTINSPGEISDDEMQARLASIGSVEILCTHVAPAVGPLATDVVGGREKGSGAVLRYIQAHQPSHHYFGDIHQPQAVTWRIGNTLSRNVGYFRATGRVYHHRAG